MTNCCEHRADTEQNKKARGTDRKIIICSPGHKLRRHRLAHHHYPYITQDKYSNSTSNRSPASASQPAALNATTGNKKHIKHKFKYDFSDPKMILNLHI